MSDALQVRELGPHDAAASKQLGREAFGHSGDVPPVPENWPDAGDHVVGAFAGNELIGKVVGRDYATHFAEVEVKTWGIAGVTVRAEDRGRGALTGLFEATFAAARGCGAAISTLFPTAPRIYRKFGYELVGAFDHIELPTATVAGMTVPPGISVHRATAADIPEVRACYARWASGQHGPLTRTGPSFTTTDAELAAEFTGITVVRDAHGAIVGYASWDRGEGYDQTATLAVWDLIALTPAAAQALWAVVGSFSSVTGQIRLQTSGDDTVRLVLPVAAWTLVSSTPYMLTVLDVAAAFSARVAPAMVTTTLDFAVAGHFLADQDGSYSLRVGAGELDCQRTGVGGPGVRTCTPQGLALTFAGTQSSANLRMSGHLHGGDVADDAAWDAVFGGRQFHVRDYF